ncbi:hypothetical protein TNCV_3116931 [Trichonephila clavipes]|nr:hypothetical protein TNCV_3116931 [Trichonephila clavipes]
MVNAVIDTGAQMPVVRPDVVEGQSINNRGSIQITSAFGEHEMERNRSAHGSPHFSPIPLVLLDNKPKRLIPALTLYLVNHLEG